MKQSDPIKVIGYTSFIGLIWALFKLNMSAKKFYKEGWKISSGRLEYPIRLPVRWL